MTNIYIFGANKFIKESVKGFDPKKYRISSTDNPDLFKIQLSKEEDPRSIILIDKNKVETPGGLKRINPFRDKNKLDVDFIKNHPLLNEDLSTISVEDYNQVSASLPKSGNTTEEESTIQETTETSMEDVVDNTINTEGEDDLEEEFDLETLLSNGIETSVEDNIEDDEEDFDLEALIASETSKGGESETGVNVEDDEDFDLEALIASETSKGGESEAGVNAEDDEDFDLEALIASETSKDNIVKEEIIEPSKTEIDEIPTSTNDNGKIPTHFEDPRIMLPEEIASELLNLISKLLKGHEIDVNINITTNKKSKDKHGTSSPVIENEENITNDITNSNETKTHNSKEEEKEDLAEFEKIANDIINSKQKEVEDFANIKNSKIDTIGEDKKEEPFDIETLIADVENITNRFKNNTNVETEETTQADKKKAQNKTLAQNMMEHLSEDEMAEMVLSGKL